MYETEAPKQVSEPRGAMLGCAESSEGLAGVSGRFCTVRGGAEGGMPPRLGGQEEEMHVSCALSPLEWGVNCNRLGCPQHLILIIAAQFLFS
jgi:hypothetical protein